MLRSLALFLFLHATSAAAEAPAVGRPSEHFYGAVGEHVRVAVKAAPLSVRVEDPLVLTIAITGAENPEQIERPDLRRLGEYSGNFYIDDLPDERQYPDRRIFRYRLRPKTERAASIPPLMFHYYDPRLKYFATTAAQEKITLTVTPRSPAISPGANDPEISGPDWLFETAPDHAILHEKHVGFRLGEASARLITLLGLLLPAVAFGVWFILWRWFSPDAAKLAGLRRAHAVRLALDGLRRLSHLPPPEIGAKAAVLVRSFLSERLGLPSHCITPSEIGEFLRKAGLSDPLVARAMAFFRDSDFARFGPPGAAPDGLTAMAEKLVLDVEGAQ
jgi:hypothetical protein